jgi:aminoglycoside phosphotransferase (APT) family kinase protein
MNPPIRIDASALQTRSRLATYALWDNFEQPRVHHCDEVPWHGEAITPEWLTTVFANQSPAARALKVTILGGDNGSSARRNIAIEWNAAGQDSALPQRLFTKSTPTLAMRLSAGKAAPAEGRFLTDLRPDLPIEAPTCFYTARDEVSGRSFHLMNDLTVARGAVFCRAEAAIDRDKADQIIDTLAILHGTFLNPNCKLDYSWLRPYENFFNAAARNGIETGHDQAMIEAVDVIPQNITAQKDHIWAAAVASLQLHDSSARTVIHSDVHLGNWYVTEDGRMGLSDWARVCRGYWGRDLAYSLMTVLTVEHRRIWERGLLERYIDKFAEVSGIQRDFNEAWEAYRRQACLALLMWTPTLCPPPTLPDMQPKATSLTMINRITTAMDDLDVLSLT